jgi:hypothetical protein
MEVKEVRRGQKGPQEARSQERLHTLKVKREGEKSWIPGEIRMGSKQNRRVQERLRSIASKARRDPG